MILVQWWRMFGVRGGGVTEMTPFVGTGYAAPIVVDDSAPVISVEIDIADGIIYHLLSMVLETSLLLVKNITAVVDTEWMGLS